jgi:predicted 3-demethylubiquinone-9 3-methyltransferase (glyoxalase superfamily)
MPQTITPYLWFDTQAEEAARFYVSIFKNSEITHITHHGDASPGEAGGTMVVAFRLDGQEFLALNGGPQYTFTEAISFLIPCKDQEEVDYFWDKLTAGGEPGPCGWLKDKYGVSWQVTPTILLDYIRDPDPVKANRVMQTMMKMGKLDLAPLHAAYNA